MEIVKTIVYLHKHQISPLEISSSYIFNMLVKKEVSSFLILFATAGNTPA